MARKPPAWRQPSLFPPDPAHTTEPQDNVNSHPEGAPHAVQNDRPRTPATTNGASRGTPSDPQTAADHGSPRQGSEGETRNLEAGTPSPAPQAATRHRFQAKPWRWLSTSWRIVCTPGLFRTRPNHFHSTKRWLISKNIRREGKARTRAEALIRSLLQWAREPKLIAIAAPGSGRQSKHKWANVC